jgi:hypothetical protein
MVCICRYLCFFLLLSVHLDDLSALGTPDPTDDVLAGENNDFIPQLCWHPSERSQGSHVSVATGLRAEWHNDFLPALWRNQSVRSQQKDGLLVAGPPADRPIPPWPASRVAHPFSTASCPCDGENPPGDQAGVRPVRTLKPENTPGQHETLRCKAHPTPAM